MAEDPNSKTNDKSKKSGLAKPSVPNGDDDEMSDKDIDQFILDNDPEFFKEMEEISADKSLGFAEIEIEKQRANITHRLRQWIWSHWIRLISLSVDSVTGLFFFVLKKIKKSAVESKDSLKLSLERFQALSKKSQMIFVALVVSSVSTVTGLGILFKSKRLFKVDNRFIINMEELSKERYEYVEKSEKEPFFENIRATPNIFLIQKSVINLRPSAESPNPMAAFDLLVEGYTAEVINEIKLREGHFRDLIHSLSSQYTFEEVASPEGKKDICAAILTMLNKNLRNGQIKSVRFKTIILKP